MSTQPVQPTPSKKEEKPTLAGVNVKTRKRNVAVPHDPSGFAEGILTSFEEYCKNETTLEGKLAASGKAIDTSNLDFSRYGDTLFEIYFAGARMGVGAKLADDTKKRIDWNIMNAEAEVGAILPYIKAFAALVRRRPFLVQRLEIVLKKLLTSLEFFDDQGRKRISIVTTLVLTEKLGALPDRIFESMFNDRLVAKGTVLQVVTEIFRLYMRLTSGGVDDLVALLHKAKVANRLLDFFPPGQQTEEAFKAHFDKEGLGMLVEWQSKKLQENSVAQLEGALMGLFAEDEGVDAYLDAVKEYGENCPAEDVIKVIWKVIVQSLNMVGKNQLQLMQMILKTVKANKRLLEAYTTSAKLELALLNCVQVTCYEDSKLLKIFVDLVKHFYDLDIIGEDTIMFWYKKGSVVRGRNVFLNDIQPFVKWLDEAETED